MRRLTGLTAYAFAGLRCSHSDASQSFYRSFNAVFGKVSRCAADEVIVELLKTECLPSLLFGTKACPVNKSVLGSLEFVINNAFRKIFSTYCYDIANECVLVFNCFVSDIVYTKKQIF